MQRENPQSLPCRDRASAARAGAGGPGSRVRRRPGQRAGHAGRRARGPARSADGAAVASRHAGHGGAQAPVPCAGQAQHGHVAGARDRARPPARAAAAVGQRRRARAARQQRPRHHQQRQHRRLPGRPGGGRESELHRLRRQRQQHDPHHLHGLRQDRHQARRADGDVLAGAERRRLPHFAERSHRAVRSPRRPLVPARDGRHELRAEDVHLHLQEREPGQRRLVVLRLLHAHDQRLPALRRVEQRLCVQRQRRRQHRHLLRLRPRQHVAGQHRARRAALLQRALAGRLRLPGADAGQLHGRRQPRTASRRAADPRAPPR